MKPKEIVQLAVALVILGVSGFLIFTQLAPQRAQTKAVTVEKITPIPSRFDTDAMSRLSDVSVVRDFYVKPDLKNGIGNPRPFGPLR